MRLFQVSLGSAQFFCGVALEISGMGLQNISPEAEIWFSGNLKESQTLAFIFIIGQAATSNLSQSALSPPSPPLSPLSLFVSALLCHFPAQQGVANVGRTWHREKTFLHGWNLCPCPRGSADQIYPRAGEQNTMCVYHHLTGHVQICPAATAGHQTCPPRLPNISCTYTDTECSVNPLTSGRNFVHAEGDFLHNYT